MDPLIPGSQSALAQALARCAACGMRPLCETGAFADWPGSRPAGCPAERTQWRLPSEPGG